MDSEEKECVLPVSITCSFDTLEQKMLFEAVVLPELRAVLIKYAPMLASEENN